MDKRIACIVVTYNRKALLQECLEAIFKQTYPVEKLIIVDNASTDGTGDLLYQKGYLKDGRVLYKLMERNTGGAGGFYEGLKIARDMPFDWFWIMDDDTIPSDDCLEKLLEAEKTVSRCRVDSGRPISFLSSAIYGPKSEFMNLPRISMRPSENGYAYWYEHLKDGMVNICDATFVSILVSAGAVKRCGLPNAGFFIWGDDTEYTMRMVKYYGDAFFVGNSVAIHKRMNAKALSLVEESDGNRIKMYKYFFRNNAIIDKYYKRADHVTRKCIRYVLSSPVWLRYPNGASKMKACALGHWEAITKYKAFKRYIDSQIAGQ